VSTLFKSYCFDYKVFDNISLHPNTINFGGLYNMSGDLMDKFKYHLRFWIWLSWIAPFIMGWWSL